MPSYHLIFCHSLLLLCSTFPSIRGFSNESVLHIRWPKYWSFNFSISPSNDLEGFPLGLTGLISFQSKGLSRIFSNTTVQKHQFFGAQPSLWSSSHISTWLLEKPWKWKLLSRVRLCNRMDYTVDGIIWPKILEWVAFPFSRESSQRRDRTGVSCIAGRFFTNWAMREAHSFDYGPLSAK